jgi:hypothetical protein
MLIFAGWVNRGLARGEIDPRRIRVDLTARRLVAVHTCLRLRPEPATSSWLHLASNLDSIARMGSSTGGSRRMMQEA